MRAYYVKILTTLICNQGSNIIKFARNYDNMYHGIFLSTAYLPPVEYIFYLLNSKNAFIERHETYPKQTWRNRCKIMTSNGELDLIIPVKKVNGNKTKVHEIITHNTYNWQKKHWRAIKTAYSKAPFFIYYEDFVSQFFDKQNDLSLLINMNTEILSSILKEFGINKDINYTNEYVHRPESLTDLRYSICPKGSNTTKLYFPPYNQVFTDKFGFKANLSVIDLIFNLGPELPDYINQVKVKTT